MAANDTESIDTGEETQPASILIRIPPQKKLGVRRRHLGVNAAATHSQNGILKLLKKVSKLIVVATSLEEFSTALILLERRKMLLQYFRQIAFMEKKDLYYKLPSINRRRISLQDFREDQFIPYFRFRDRNQIQALILGFRFPSFMRAASGHRFSAEEVVLVSLYRLHTPGNSTDACFEAVFGMCNEYVSMCLKLFTEFLITNWSYLVLDNCEFYRDQLAALSDKIQEKVVQIVQRKDPNFTLPLGTLKIFGFIDNTINQMCRPGGGPTTDGPGAERNPKLLQRAFYNGWKKCHGLKWQTMDLPNGMNYHVWGPVSCRHNDLYTLFNSRADDLIGLQQMHSAIKYFIYGDSAYKVYFTDYIKCRTTEFDFFLTLQLTEDQITWIREALNSCREVIEWDYGNLGQQWSFVDYKKKLKIRKSAIAKIYLSCILLRNSYNCLNCSQSSLYFECLPPTFQQWTAGGFRNCNMQQPENPNPEQPE